MIKQLLNIVFNVSEQMPLGASKSFKRMLFDQVAFLGFIKFSSHSISDKHASLNEKLGILVTFLVIRKILGWFL